MPKNKSPENDGITKEFYEAFWNNLKTTLILIVNKAFRVGRLSTSGISHKEAVIKLIQKKEFLKTALSSLLSSNQKAYLRGRFISERGGLISDISEARNFLKLSEIFQTVDIENTFDSVNQNCLLKVLEKYGLSQ